MCLKHMRTHLASVKKYNKKMGEIYLQSQRDRKELRRQSGLCPSCGAPAEDGYIMCCNCRERLFFERVENATPIV